MISEEQFFVVKCELLDDGFDRYIGCVDVGCEGLPPLPAARFLGPRPSAGGPRFGRPLLAAS